MTELEARERNKYLSPLAVAQIHNVYGTLGVMSVEEIRAEIKDTDFSRPKWGELAQIHNIYGTLGVLTKEEMRGHLGLRGPGVREADITEPSEVATLVLKGLRQRLQGIDVRTAPDGILFIDEVDDAPYWLQGVDVSHNVIEDAYGRTFRIVVERLDD